MNTFCKNSFIFVAGFLSGVAAAYLAATHYLGLEWIEDECDENGKPESNTDIADDVEINDNKYEPIEGNSNFVDYAKYSNEYKSPEDEIEDEDIQEIDIFDEEDTNAKPEIISGNEYGVDTEYTEVELRFYLDAQLITDDWDMPIENMEDTIGSNTLNLMCENPDDTLYIRNDRLKIYYEIVPMSYDYPGVPVED